MNNYSIHLEQYSTILKLTMMLNVCLTSNLPTNHFKFCTPLLRVRGDIIQDGILVERGTEVRLVHIHEAIFEVIDINTESVLLLDPILLCTNEEYELENKIFP